MKASPERPLLALQRLKPFPQEHILVLQQALVLVCRGLLLLEAAAVLDGTVQDHLFRHALRAGDGGHSLSHHLEGVLELGASLSLHVVVHITSVFGFFKAGGRRGGGQAGRKAGGHLFKSGRRLLLRQPAKVVGVLGLGPEVDPEGELWFGGGGGGGGGDRPLEDATHCLI